MTRVGMRIALGAGVLGLLACAPTMDTERQAVARGTLGEEVYRIACQRIVQHGCDGVAAGIGQIDEMSGHDATSAGT